MQPWFAFSLLALILFGVSGVTQKLSTNHISFEASFVCFCVAMGVISVVVASTTPINWHLSAGSIALAALGGFLNGLGALTSFAALKLGGKASIVIPIVNLYPLVAVGGGWMFLGETLNARQIAGIALALAAVILLSQETVVAQPDTPVEAGKLR